jgi:hypothetical protein
MTRANLPKSAFALPSQRKYPLVTDSGRPSVSRGRSALIYAKRDTTAGNFNTIRAKVLKRYPSLKGTVAAAHPTSQRSSSRSKGRAKR